MAQQADLGAHGLPDDEKAQGNKLATLAQLRKKTTNSLDLAAMIMSDRECPDRRPHDPTVLVDRA